MCLLLLLLVVMVEQRRVGRAHDVAVHGRVVQERHRQRSTTLNRMEGRPFRICPLSRTLNTLVSVPTECSAAGSRRRRRP